MIYIAYRSKWNKESLLDLKYSMSLNDFMEYFDYIQIHEDMESAQIEDQKMKQNTKR